MFRAANRGFLTAKGVHTLRAAYSTTRKHIGIIGTGNVGVNVASSINQAGFSVTVYDLNKTVTTTDCRILE